MHIPIRKFCIEKTLKLLYMAMHYEQVDCIYIQTVFENTWCLWDTGAQTSFIVTSQLGAAVRDNKTEGSAIMDIKCVLFHYS